MDELLSACSFFLSPSPPPQLATVDENHHEVLEFASCEPSYAPASRGSRRRVGRRQSSRGGHTSSTVHHLDGDDVVRVRMVVGKDAAAVRVTSTGGGPHALRSLELQVQHACVNRVHGVTVQDVVVDSRTTTSTAASSAPCYRGSRTAPSY
ncbi:hypothetical protein ZWY2020_036405 [Hordeum vulgare]|nr:hypothetical protein ZWY2020_036405 [Hordeum vulgare]